MLPDRISFLDALIRTSSIQKEAMPIIHVLLFILCRLVLIVAAIFHTHKKKKEKNVRSFCSVKTCSNIFLDKKY